MRFSIRMFVVVLLGVNTISGVTPSGASYNTGTNILQLTFSENVSTVNVLLGRITITDGSNSHSLTGGTLPDSAYYTNTLDVSLLYGKVIDQLDQTIFGSAQTVQLWGTSATQVDAIESFNLTNCSIIFESGAFLDEDSAYSDAVTLPLTIVDQEEPLLSSASYSATHNHLQLVFNTPAQFDQIAEDRSVDGGPGDGSLAPEIGNNDPGEDRNGNGVLDFEVNILPFKIGFVDGADNSISLEGIKLVSQTEDSDTIDITLTINDAKRLETSLDLTTLAINMSEGAFRDTSYNLFASSSITVPASADSLPLTADSAAYDYAKNEFYIYFRNSENTSFDIGPSPAPVWSKIQIYNSSDNFTLTTGTPSANDNSLKLKDLSLDVLSQIENMIQYNDSGEIVDSVFCSLDAYTVYDRSENGNVAAPKIPIRFYSGSSSSTYATPMPDKDDTGGFVYYDAIGNILSFSWDTKIGTFKGNDLPDDDEIGENDFSELSGIYLYDHVDTLKLSSGRVWRSSSKKTISVELSEADEVLVESNGQKDSLHFLLDYYTFASTKDNGTPAITLDSSAFVQYSPDTLGPAITSVQYDIQSNSFTMNFTQPVSKDAFATDRFNFQNVNGASVFDGSLVTSLDSLDNYTSTIIVNLSTSGSSILDAMNNSDKTAFTMYVNDSTFIGLDNVLNAADTVHVDYGRNYWITSFEAFPSATAQKFCTIGYIGTQCDIYIDVSSKDGFTDSLLTVIGQAFEDTVTFDSNVVQYGGQSISIASTVRSFAGNENDVDQNGKVIFVFTDILDEYGLGRNDTKSSLFVHGYSTPSDTVSNGQYANGGEVIYIDTNPLNVTSTNNDKNILFHAITHEYTKMVLQHNKPTEEPWILEGVAQLMQKKIFGDVVFFGESTSPSTSTGNQLTYLATGVNKLKGRTDQHNVNIFFTYLQERLAASSLENEPEWQIVSYICETQKVGVASVDTALAAVGASKTFAEYFADYGMACYLDLVNVDSTYGGIYSFESLNLESAPSGKSASTLKWDKAGNKPAPFMFKNIAPWSYNWIIMQGYIVDISGNIIYKSPDLSATDTLIFNGYDGIKFKLKKLALKSGFLDLMTTDYEVVDFSVDTTTGFGKLPVTTSADFTFKELGVDSLSQPGTLIPDTTTGIQLLMLLVVKVDDAPAPPTSDFWISNINTDPDFSDLYGFQNQGAPNNIDLFVASQRAVYDSLGNESAIVMYETEIDSGQLALSILHDDINDFRSYHTSFNLRAEADYTFIFKGTDASGNIFTPDSLSVSTVFYNSSSRTALKFDQSNIILEPSALNTNQFLAGMAIPKKLIHDIPKGLSIVSQVIAFGPQDKKLNISSSVNLYSERLTSDSRVYQYYQGQWHNIGGSINQQEKVISANTSAFGRFVILRGDGHLPETDELTLPGMFALHPNYPNPFNPSTTISYSLPEPSDVSIRIFDILGRSVWNKKDFNKNPGIHRITWYGKNTTGQPLASGVYFIEMKANKFISYRKILLIK